LLEKKMHPQPKFHIIISSQSKVIAAIVIPLIFILNNLYCKSGY
jgi:hypothetical protein